MEPGAGRPSRRCGPLAFDYGGGGGAVAGEPLRTRLFALDLFGRRAAQPLCETIGVHLRLEGGARVNVSDAKWRRGELALDIENDMAETLEAELTLRRVTPPSQRPGESPF